MSELKKKLIHGAIGLAGGQAVGQAAGLLRAFVIARALGPDSYGIAGLFAVTLRFFEIISSLSERMIIHSDPDADNPEFIGTLNTFSVARGLVLALILVLISGFLSRFFGVPDAHWAFMCLAILPLLRGFLNWDPCRLEREMKYYRTIAVDTGSQLIALVSAVLITQYIQDYSAMLWVLIVQNTMFVALSHILACRRYVFLWSPHIAVRMIKFSLPLMANGLLLYLSTQGDRIILGAEGLFPQYSKSVLGIYLAVAQLTTVGTDALAGIMMKLNMPTLVKSKDQPIVFRDRFVVSLKIYGIISALHIALFCTIGDWLVLMVFGQEFVPSYCVIALFSIASGLRLFRASLTCVALSRADSTTPLFANCVRFTAFVGSLISAFLGQSMVWFLIWAVVAEVASFIFTTRRCRKRHDLKIALYHGPLFITLTVAAVGPGIYSTIQFFVDGIIPGVLGLTASIGLALFFLLSLLQQKKLVIPESVG